MSLQGTSQDEAPESNHLPQEPTWEEEFSSQGDLCEPARRHL